MMKAGVIGVAVAYCYANTIEPAAAAAGAAVSL